MPSIEPTAVRYGVSVVLPVVAPAGGNPSIKGGGERGTLGTIRGRGHDLGGRGSGGRMQGGREQRRRLLGRASLSGRRAVRQPQTWCHQRSRERRGWRSLCSAGWRRAEQVDSVRAAICCSSRIGSGGRLWGSVRVGGTAVAEVDVTTAQDVRSRGSSGMCTNIPGPFTGACMGLASRGVHKCMSCIRMFGMESDHAHSPPCSQSNMACAGSGSALEVEWCTSRLYTSCMMISEALEGQLTLIQYITCTLLDKY